MVFSHFTIFMENQGILFRHGTKSDLHGVTLGRRQAPKSRGSPRSSIDAPGSGTEPSLAEFTCPTVVLGQRSRLLHISLVERPASGG